MRRGVLLIVLIISMVSYAAKYEMAYRLSGGLSGFMPDGKVDPFVKNPIGSGSFAVEFLPTGRWHSLQQWNNASIGVGATYMNLGNEAKLGSAVTAYGYINQPFYNGTHFRIGVRPSLGLAVVTKRYSNTYEGTTPYQDHTNANWSIGSVLNGYLSMELYADFPIRDGWEITLNGGWHHISNGSFMHPNAGYNMFGGEIGVRYQPGMNTYQSPEPDVPRKLYDGVEKPWAVEISATGGAKQNYYADNRNGQIFFGAAAVHVAAYWVPLSIFRLGAGVDGFYDAYYMCVSKDFAKDNPGAPVTYFGKTYLKESNIANCFRVGFSIQPEVIIGHLTAGIHVGFYLYDPVKNLEPYAEAKAADEAGTPLNRGVFYAYDWTKASNYQDGWCYMHFVAKYHIVENLFVQVGLKTHGVRAEYLNAGVGVSF